MFHSYSVHLASHRTTHSLSFIHCKGYPIIGVNLPPVISSALQRQSFRRPAWVIPSVISSASQWVTPSVVRQTACESPRQSFRHPDIESSRQPFHQATSESHCQSFYQPAIHQPRQALRQSVVNESPFVSHFLSQLDGQAQIYNSCVSRQNCNHISTSNYLEIGTFWRQVTAVTSLRCFVLRNALLDYKTWHDPLVSWETGAPPTSLSRTQQNPPTPEDLFTLQTCRSVSVSCSTAAS